MLSLNTGTTYIVEGVKVLGIIFIENMVLNEILRYKCSKLSKAAGTIYRYRHIIPNSAVILV